MAVFVVLILIIASFSQIGYADWIRCDINCAYFSPESGIDSIERFLVLTDPDTCKLFGEGIVPLGDITGDGIDDIMIVRYNNWLEPGNTAFIYFGGKPPDTIPDKIFEDRYPGFTNIGDVNGDGYDDLGYIHADTVAPTSSFQLYFGGPNIDDMPDFIIPNTSSRTPMARPVDLNADGHLELPLQVEVGYSPVKIYRIDEGRDTVPEYIISDSIRGFSSGYYFADNMATGDFNGDNYPDLAVATFLDMMGGHDTSVIKFYWGGPNFDTSADFIIADIFSFQGYSRFGEYMIPLKDFNGDGYEDIFIGGNADRHPWGIYFGGQQIDDKIDVVLNWTPSGYYSAFTSASNAGDINNDGYQDLILGYSDLMGFKHEIFVFLGGPNADSIADIYLENLTIPEGQIDLGMVVARIGDFNGDGIDDFAARSRTSGGSLWYGQVNFFAGWDTNATNVEYHYEPILPQNFKLEQNYPNPFNSSTTIKFDLPYKIPVKLGIYNILGQEVIILINKTLAAGEYEVEWDGKGANGEPLSTGVYFCRLIAGENKELKTIILLK